MAESVVLRLELKIASLERKLAAAERRMSRTEKRFKAIGSQIQGHLAGMFAIGAVSNFARSQVELVKKIDQSNRALKAITGTTEEYNRAKSMLRVSAEEFGVNLLDLTKSYVRFYAASKSSTLATKELDAIFNKMTKSAAVLGLSADETHGVLKALEQMMSKGKVQAEELRGQLGDRLPGAFVIMAQSMDITTGELDKMLKKGSVLADEVLPKFAQEYEKAVGAEALTKIETLVGEFNRFNTAWISLVESAEDGDGVISNALKSIVGGTTDFFTALTGVNEGIISMTDLIGALGNNKLPMLAQQVQVVLKTIADSNQKEVDRVNSIYNNFFDGLVDGGVTLEEFESRLSDAKNGTILYNDEVRESVMTLDMMNAILSKYNEKGKEEAEIANKRAEAAKKLAEEEEKLSKLYEKGLFRISLSSEFKDPTSESDLQKIKDQLYAGLPPDMEFLSVDQIEGDYENVDEKVEEIQERMAKRLDEWNSTLSAMKEVIEQTIQGMFIGIGQAIGSEEDIFDAMFQVLGRGLQQLGGLMIAYGIKLEEFKAAAKTLNGFLAVAAGTALVALGAAISKSSSNIHSGGSSGGGRARNNGGRFIGTQTSQSIQFEPIMLRLQGKDLVGAIRVNDRDASL